MSADHWHYASDIHGGAEEHHRHHASDIHGGAEEHHRHHDTERDVEQLRCDLAAALDRIRELEGAVRQLCSQADRP